MNMQTKPGLASRVHSAALQIVIAAIGLAAIVGSGGGGLDDSICDVYPDSCGPQPPPPPSLSIDPPSVTVQVGSPLSLMAVIAHGSGAYSYQWRRSADGGATFNDIPGATAKTYSLASVTLADDGAIFMALAWQGNATPLQATTQLAVSATPGIVLGDQEFVASNWQAAPAIVAGYPSFTHAEERAPADGHPGAYRKMTVQVAPGSGVSNVTHLWLAATYDPALQGAIRVIDHAEDCILLNPSESNFVETGVFIEQCGRRYLSDASICSRAGWAGVAFHSLRQQDLRQFDGPACNIGESCPDFSATGATLRFGYVRHASGSQGESVQHGIDNWKVTIWRR